MSKQRPDADDRHGYERPMSRSEARDAAVRDQLEPLAPGERPSALLAAIVLAVAIAAANLILLAAGYRIAGPGNGASGTLVVILLMAALAAGMWMRQYWAVVAFEVVLGVTCASAGLSLLVASNLLAAAVALGALVVTGVLFYKLVRVMARLKVPREE